MAAAVFGISNMTTAIVIFIRFYLLDLLLLQMAFYLYRKIRTEKAAVRWIACFFNIIHRVVIPLTL